MTERFATTKTDRRKWIRHLQELEKRLQNSGDTKASNAIAAEARKGFKFHDEASAIRKALKYVERHVNLKTGELTIPLYEIEETA